MAIQYTITAPEAEKYTVEVVFFNEGAPHLVHRRHVNAVFDDTGVYNAEATEERVAQVALGVDHKLAVGAITLVDETQSEDPAEPEAEPTA
ncbi:hypothetical protein PU634_10245 [Oceanimonas pelagia]|uniref:Uncharacterized protein n=1 Tax=Oceanimonas pelagia TaxID=3028314 RepID=A0AA50KKJ8_9GAMM|nr:hypothetical protein [Oceanimonas pelagia]WMC09495.1 hypothetical protein PU634_10245 [Oceanimonas pelagia]